MNEFAAALLVLIALAAVGNFASDDGTLSHGCAGSQDSWVRLCR